MIDQNHNGYKKGYIVLQYYIVQGWYYIGLGYNNKLMKYFVNIIYTIVIFDSTCVMKLMKGLQ